MSIDKHEACIAKMSRLMQPMFTMRASPILCCNLSPCSGLMVCREWRAVAACSKMRWCNTALHGIGIHDGSRFGAALLVKNFAPKINPQIDTTKCQGIMPCAVRVPVFGSFLAARSWDRQCVSNDRGQQGLAGPRMCCPFFGPPKRNFSATRNRRPKKPRQIGTYGCSHASRRARENSALWRRGVRSCRNSVCLPLPL